jgi:hypothetical protein
VHPHGVGEEGGPGRSGGGGSDGSGAGATEASGALMLEQGRGWLAGGPACRMEPSWQWEGRV